MQSLEASRAQMVMDHGKNISRLVEDNMDLQSSDDSELITRISTTGKAMLDAEVWFTGLSTTLSKLEAVHDEVTNRVIKAVETTQEKVQAIHGKYRAISSDHTNSEVRRIADMACQSASMLFDALEVLRWDMLNRQAENDVTTGKVSETFSSADDLISSLRA